MPALRIGDVAHLDQIGNDAAEVERRAHHQEALRPSETGKLDAKPTPYAAARAVRADQETAGPRVPLAAPLERDLYTGWLLSDGLNRAVEAELAIDIVAQLLVQNARELRLLALTAKWIWGHVR